MYLHPYVLTNPASNTRLLHILFALERGLLETDFLSSGALVCQDMAPFCDGMIFLPSRLGSPNRSRDSGMEVM